MKERACFRCGKQLNFEDYIQNNGLKSENELIKIWNCKYVELYCCNCFCLKTKYEPLYKYKKEKLEEDYFWF